MVSQVRDRCNMCAGRCREPRCIRSPGRGSQRLHRALGGTRILLAAAPTAPPCFCRWQRSSLLHRGFFPRRTIRRVLRVALAAFSAAPWQGFEKAERCPSLASLFPPQAAVGSAAVRIHPCSPFSRQIKQKLQYPLDTGVLGGAKQPKSEPLPSGASLAAISSKVMVFVPSL